MFHTKKPFIIILLNTIPQPSWEYTNKNMEIKEKTKPCCWLMLRHGGNDGNMNLGVCCVPQGIESKHINKNII